MCSHVNHCLFHVSIVSSSYFVLSLLFVSSTTTAILVSLLPWFWFMFRSVLLNSLHPSPALSPALPLSTVSTHLPTRSAINGKSWHPLVYQGELQNKVVEPGVLHKQAHTSTAPPESRRIQLASRNQTFWLSLPGIAHPPDKPWWSCVMVWQVEPAEEVQPAQKLVLQFHWTILTSILCHQIKHKQHHLNA